MLEKQLVWLNSIHDIINTRVVEPHRHNLLHFSKLNNICHSFDHNTEQQRSDLRFSTSSTELTLARPLALAVAWQISIRPLATVRYQIKQWTEDGHFSKMTEILVYACIDTYFDVNVQKATLSHFEHKTQLRSRRNTIEETFFSMRVDVNEISSYVSYVQQTFKDYEEYR